MKQRTLGKGGPRVSAIGFGAMVLSPGIYGEVDDQASIATLQRGIDVGLTLIDTAFAYGGGHNEDLIGRAVRGRRDQVVLATKGGLAFGASGPVYDGRPVVLRANLEISLRRLGTPHVDVYYLHNADPNVPIEESIGEMARFVAEGKVRFLGVSNLPLEQVRRAHAITSAKRGERTASSASRAIVLPPPGGNTLFVTAYYSDFNKMTLVGQRWSGCGQPSGQWGATTSFFNVFFPAC